MRSTLFATPASARGPVSRALADLEKRVGKIAARQVEDIRRQLGVYAVCEPSLSGLSTVARVRSTIRELRDGADFSPQQVTSALARAHHMMQQAIVGLDVARAGDPARILLQDAAREVGLTLDELRPYLGLGLEAVSMAAPGVSAPTELLFDAHRLLFPPERMALIAGRVVAGRTLLTTLFDVTPRGSVNSGHVAGDPQRLAWALLAMERAGAYLAAWIHSHPGIGAAATEPSSTDRRQYAAFIRQYTDDLVGIIVVSDGHLRIWGDAVETGRVPFHLVGDGVHTICEVNHVYRLL